MNGRREAVTADSYAWVTDWVGIGVCVALVEARSAVEVLSALVPDPATEIAGAPAVRDWADEQSIPEYATAVEATEHGDWVVSVESNGYLAAVDDVIRRLSERRRAIVLFENVNAVMRFAYARDGSLVRAFDPLLYDNVMIWEGERLPEEEGLVFAESPMPCAFALAERITGLQLKREFLDGRDGWIAVGHYPSYSVAPGRSWREDKESMERETREELARKAAQAVASHVAQRWAGRAPTARLRDVGGSVIGIVQLDRDLVDEIEGLDAHAQRELARWAAHRACSVAGLDTVEWVATALAALDADRPLPAPFDDIHEVWASWRRDPTLPRTLVDAPEGGERNRLQQAFALPSVRGAAAADPLRAAFDALYTAVVTVGSDYPALFADVRRRFLSAQ